MCYKVHYNTTTRKSALGKKKSKMTIHTRAVRLAIPGKQKVHWEKKGKKTLHAHAVRLAIPGKKKVHGKKKEKRLYTHTRRTPRHSWKKKVHWEKKCKKTIHTHKPDI